MSGNSILVDTNILLYFLKGDSQVQDLLSDKNIFLSFITELELMAFPLISTEDEQLILDFLDNCTIIGINAIIKKKTIDLRKSFRMKLPDAIIASTGIYLNIPLLTSDKQFKVLDEPEIILFEF